MPDSSDLVDPGALAGALRAIFTRWREGPNRDAAMLQAGDGDFETYLAKAIGDLRLDVHRLLERLEADAERQRVMLNLCAEHRREAMRSRRDMLGDAGVAVLVSPLTTAEVARVERALRMLDPEDLELLRALRLAGASEEMLAQYEADGDRAGQRSLGGHRLDVLVDGHLRGANLLAAGCLVRVAHVNQGGLTWGMKSGEVVHEAVELTPIGELVLRFMHPGAVAEPPEGKPDDGAEG